MAGEDPRYTAWLHDQPCSRCGTVLGVEVHHPLWGTTYSPELPRPLKAIPNAKKGKAQRSHDHFAIPLCFKSCHEPGIHQGGGAFANTTPAERELFERVQITIHRRRYAMQFPERIGEQLVEPRAKPSKLRQRRSKRERFKGWTVAGVIDLLRKEARHRPADVAAALMNVVELVESDGKETHVSD